MAQPAEMKDSNPTDSERVYCTNALIKRVGGAVAVSLEDATLPGTAKNKHMTILFRRGKKWSNDEIELISKETDNWIKQKYGSNQAPVTFSTVPWGKRSVQISGDLAALCLHLRNKFGSMSQDKQRVPHVELYKHGRGNNNNKNDNDNNKTCHICDEPGHFRKNCPQKEDKKGGKKYKKDRADNGDKKGEKVKQRLGRMISKMQELKQRKQREIQLLDEQEKKLQELLNNADNLDNKTLRNEIKNIAKSFKNKRKEFKGHHHGHHHNKRRKSGKMRKFKPSKQSKKERKELNKQRKQEKKELNKQRKQQRKLEKEERKRLKKEKLDKLTAARLDILPLNKTEIGDSDILNIYVDGYNIIGCDAICRKNMRGKGGGMRKSRARLAKLLQENFINKFKTNQLKYEYKPVVYLWFDGNGKNNKYGDIEITFSTKKQIVDDKLVEKFSKNNRKQNSNILVITADKELTLRLYNIGVKVMKSSTFYKTYLAVNHPTDNNNDNNDDEKKEEEIIGATNDDDDFVQIIANKMNSMQYEDEDTPDGDNDDDDDEGNYTPDEIEGDISGNHHYQTPENDEEEDYEFTSIFGEDMDIIDFD